MTVVTEVARLQVSSSQRPL